MPSQIGKLLFDRYLGSYPIKKEDKTPKKLLIDRVRSVSSDSIPRAWIDVGGGGGIEYFALMYNMNLSVDFHIMNLKNAKLSLSNRTGLYGGIAPVGIFYTYPAIKYQQNISNVWLALSFGREYGNISSGESNIRNYQLDFRFDVGLKIYDTSRFSTELYVPVRIGNAFPWYFTGINMTCYYRFSQDNTLNTYKRALFQK
ncbi:MAG: hypothetical protein AAGG68_29945 [Bacteroidota bacterium]